MSYLFYIQKYNKTIKLQCINPAWRYCRCYRIKNAKNNKTNEYQDFGISLALSSVLLLQKVGRCSKSDKTMSINTSSFTWRYCRRYRINIIRPMSTKTFGLAWRYRRRYCPKTQKTIRLMSTKTFELRWRYRTPILGQ